MALGTEVGARCNCGLCFRAGVLAWLLSMKGLPPGRWRQHRAAQLLPPAHPAIDFHAGAASQEEGRRHNKVDDAPEGVGEACIEGAGASGVWGRGAGTRLARASALTMRLPNRLMERGLCNIPPPQTKCSPYGVTPNSSMGLAPSW